MTATDEPFDVVMARLKERYPQSAAGHYTTDDLRKIPPCPICGARARIVAGRLEQPCIREKHSPKVFHPPQLVATPVQRSFDDDEREPWWHK